MRSALILAAFALPAITAPVPDSELSTCLQQYGCSGTSQASNDRRQPEPFGRSGGGRRRSAEPERVHGQVPSIEVSSTKSEPSVDGDISSETQDEGTEAIEARFSRANHEGRSVRGPRTASNKRSIEDEDEDSGAIEARFSRANHEGRSVRGPRTRSIEDEDQDEDTEALEARFSRGSHGGRSFRGPRTGSNKRTPEAEPINRINGEKRNAEPGSINRGANSRREPESELRV